MDDLISRQAAIDAIKRNAYRHTYLDQIIDIVSELPPAQPEQRWIPVSEKMPEEHEWIGTKRFGTTKSDEVYVTFETPNGDRFTKHLSFQNGNLSVADQQTINAFYEGSVPVAWMPLPKPYGVKHESD